VNQAPKKVYQQPPSREVTYHCEYCHREGHLVEFCFRRKRDERRELEWNNQDRYHSSVGFEEPSLFRKICKGNLKFLMKSTCYLGLLLAIFLEELLDFN